MCGHILPNGDTTRGIDRLPSESVIESKRKLKYFLEVPAPDTQRIARVDIVIHDLLSFERLALKEKHMSDTSEKRWCTDYLPQLSCDAEQAARWDWVEDNP